MSTSREDPGIFLESSGLPGVPCMWGHPGRILGSPWAPPDCLEGYVCGVIKEKCWDVLGILWIAWRLVSVEEPRKTLGCPWDPLDSMEGCVRGDN